MFDKGRKNSDFDFSDVRYMMTGKKSSRQESYSWDVDKAERESYAIL